MDRRTSPPGSILQPCQTKAQKPLPLEQDGRLGATHQAPNGRVGLSLGGDQDNSGSLNLPLGQDPAPGPEF